MAERGPGLPLPGDRSPFEELGEEVGLLFEELLVVGEVVAEQGERVDAGTPAEDDLRPATGDGVERGIALEHPDRIVGAQDRHRRAEADTAGAGGEGAGKPTGGRHK